MSDHENIGFFVCSLVDILGQKQELDKLTSGLTSTEILEIFQGTYGKIKLYRKTQKDSLRFFNDIKLANAFSGKIYSTEFSDLVVSHYFLSGKSSFEQISGIYLLLLSLSDVFLNMLAKGIPLRGAVDIGLGIKTENDELYGQALSKAYKLESQEAKWIRILIGDELFEFIQKMYETETDEVKNLAKGCLDLIEDDSDSKKVLGFLSEGFKGLTGFSELALKAKGFLEAKYQELIDSEQDIVAEKYSNVLRYFESKNIVNC